MFTAYHKPEEDCEIFYKVYGSNRNDSNQIDPEQKTLIFLHGGPGVVDHTLYAPYWQEFSAEKNHDTNLQVIFIDHRGSGESFVTGDAGNINPEKWNLKQWGQDVYNFFTQHEITKPIIAGVSFGGVVAMSCATQYPTELGGLILCDTDARFDLKTVIQKFEECLQEKKADADTITEVCTAANNMFLNTNEKTYSEYIRLCLPHCASKNPYTSEEINACKQNIAATFHYNKNELLKYNFLPQLETIECETLVLAGGLNPIHNLPSAIETTEHLKYVTFAPFADAGSPVYNDKPQEVAQVIFYFIKKVCNPKHTETALFQCDRKPTGNTHESKKETQGITHA